MRDNLLVILCEKYIQTLFTQAFIHSNLYCHDPKKRPRTSGLVSGLNSALLIREARGHKLALV